MEIISLVCILIALAAMMYFWLPRHADPPGRPSMRHLRLPD